MSGASRRTGWSFSFAGADITEDLRPYFLSLEYTDNEDGETDDLQLKLQDREGLWMQSWLTQAVEAAAAGRLKLSAVITPEHWGGGGSLPTGTFELDSVSASGPPSTVVIKGTSLAFSEAIRQTKKEKVWENYSLSGIANEIAGNGGTTCMYQASSDPFYARQEQDKESDISFLSALCSDAGISLKCTDGMLVLFDQPDYESMAPVLTIPYGAAGGYTKYKLATGSADTQYASCRVRYPDPATGTCIEGVAKVADYNDEDTDNQQLEVYAKVASAGEAQKLAEKRLREHNKFQRTATFTLPGNTALAAGLTFSLTGWGGWSGKYIISSAKHTVGTRGYTTQITGRRCLEGY